MAGQSKSVARFFFGSSRSWRSGFCCSASATDKGLVFVSDFNLDNLRQFRATLPNKNESARVKLGALKSFFRFRSESGWVPENCARRLKAAKFTERKIVSLTAEEFKAILKAYDDHGNKKNRNTSVLWSY